MARIEAITFDLWDTIVADDSDEQERTRRRLPSKRDARRQLLYEALSAEEPIEQRQVDLAFDVADSAFNHVWRQQHVTWTVGQRVDVILKGLGRELPKRRRKRLIHGLETMEVEVPPELIDGCAEALAELSAQFSLAIVSDAIVTPGRALRQLLDAYGVKQFFSAFAFSDEVGRSKPHRAMFQCIADEIRAPLSNMVHIGDREHNDVRGAHDLGMRAILFTATRDDDVTGTTADAVCEAYSQLPTIVKSLQEANG